MKSKHGGGVSSSKRYSRGMIFILSLLLSGLGLYFVFEASSVRALTDFGDSFHFLKLQAIWFAFGFVIMCIVSQIDYHKWYFVSFLIMAATFFFLVAVLIPGIGQQAGGARRWIGFGAVNLQPSEFAKFATVIYLSSWFIQRQRKRFFSFLLLVSALIFLIILQPDMGTAMIIFSLSIILYFLAGLGMHYLLLVLPAAFGGFFFLVQVSPYRFRRLLAFFNPALDPLGITYHINQILISLTNGGIFGQGLGASKQKFLFLPEAHTDSIFAIIGEEIGFIGSVMLIIAFLLLIYYLYKTAFHAPDRFGKLLAGGITAYFGLQILTNLAGMVNLMPLTGVPLPFISYGGSHLLTSFVLIGIVLNIANQSRVKS